MLARFYIEDEGDPEAAAQRADAPHLALSAHCTGLAGFEGGFTRRARRLELRPPVSSAAA